jgi:hypothetical protein
MELTDSDNDCRRDGRHRSDQYDCPGDAHDDTAQRPLPCSVNDFAVTQCERKIYWTIRARVFATRPKRRASALLRAKGGTLMTRPTMFRLVSGLRRSGEQFLG